ncbi:MAG: DJ-1/PfpI family protein, partial [Longimicrobiales bacterium]
ALRFELGKLEVPAIRERMVGLLAEVDATLAARVAEGLGIKVPRTLDKPINMSIPADGDVAGHQPRRSAHTIDRSEALSMANTIKDSIKSRKVAFLVADGFDEDAVATMKRALTAAGGQAKIVAPRGGTLKGANGKSLKVDFSLLTTSSVLFDAVFVPGGAASVAALEGEADAIHFVNEAYKHCKAIGAVGEGVDLLKISYVEMPKAAGKKGRGGNSGGSDGVVANREAGAGAVAVDFIAAIAQHRHWGREDLKSKVPA